MQAFGWIVISVSVALLAAGWLLGRVRWRWASALSVAAGITARLGGVGSSLGHRPRSRIAAEPVLFSAALLMGGLITLALHPERVE